MREFQTEADQRWPREERLEWGYRLKQLRRFHEVTQVDLARAVGLDRKTVMFMEQGVYAPYARTVKRVEEWRRKLERAAERELENLAGLS
jgi:DNA-binding XRE family transcriptional regulator